MCLALAVSIASTAAVALAASVAASADARQRLCRCYFGQARTSGSTAAVSCPALRIGTAAPESVMLALPLAGRRRDAGSAIQDCPEDKENNAYFRSKIKEDDIIKIIHRLSLL